MAKNRELERIIDDLQPQQVECLALIARRMAARSREGWTGQENIEINYSCGGQASVFCQTREALLTPRPKRKARNGGI